MQTKRIDPKKSKIVIDITQNGQAQNQDLRQSQNANTLGVLPGQNSTPKRRLRLKSQSKVAITLYDMGLYLQDGVFREQNLSFGINPGYVGVYINDFTQEYADSLNSVLLSRVNAQASNNYKKIVKETATNYGLIIYNGEDVIDTSLPENWNSTNEIELPPGFADNIQFFISSIAYRAGYLAEINLLPLYDSSYLYFTSSPDYTSPTIAYRVRDKDRFFLAPPICFMRGRSETGELSTGITAEHLISGYRFYPREVFTNETNPNYGKKLVRSLTVSWGVTAEPETYNRIYDHFKIVRNLNNIAAFSQHGISSTPYPVFNFPTNNPAPPAYPSNRFYLASADMFYYDSDFIILLAVVQRGNNFIYVWRRVS